MTEPDEATPDEAMRVLVVDDSATIRRTFERNLKKRGYATVLADGGEKALRLIETDAADVVLLDFRMPGMDGLETFKHIRVKQPHLPVIMITGEGSTQLAVEFVKAGGAAYVQKPVVNFDDLECKILRSIEFVRLRRECDAERAGRLAAEESDRLKSVFLANINHEFRTPLTIILNSAENAQQRCGDENLKKRLGRIISGAGRLLRLIVNILDMSKIQAGQVEYRPSICDLGELARDACASMEPLAEERTLSVAVNNELPSGCMINCDAEWIGRVIENLLGNAVKFSDEGTRITIRLRQTDTDTDTVEFSIANRGTMIPAEERELIFQPFTQSSATFSGIEGTGIGLALCKSVISAHGGDIWAETGLEDGAVFRFTLPREGHISLEKRGRGRGPNRRRPYVSPP